MPESFGRYRVLKPLGRGAMGTVYLADDTQLKRQVALKIPRFDGDDAAELLARFYREAQAAATLRHPNICPVYDVGEIDGQHYLSMAYIKGQSLADVIKSGQPIAERSTLGLIRKLALALQEADDHGIVHRDLKPANVMIDDKREPIIMDFGLAILLREEASRITQQGVIVGSPAYMSPEQMEGNPDKITAATDQYSLGVMLFELISGQLPFRGGLSAIINHITTKPVPTLSSLMPDIDPRIDGLCRRMMAKSAEERFPSMKAVAEEITRIVATVGSKSEKKSVTTSVITAKGTESLVAQRDKWSAEIPALLSLAKELFRKHDFAETRKVLAKIPAGVRTPEIQQLLEDASDKDDECCLLLTDIDLALNQHTPADLQPLLKRLLQLKPGHKPSQQLLRNIEQYGVEKAIRIRRRDDQFEDPAGQTIHPRTIALFVGGLFTLCAAVYVAATAYQSPRGTVVMNITNPNIAVMFQEQKLTEQESGRSFSLKPEDPQLVKVDVHGVSINEATRTISVAKNETKTLTFGLEPDGTLRLDIAETRQSFSVADAVNKVKGPEVNAAVTETKPLPAAATPTVATASPATPSPKLPDKPTRKVFFTDDYDKPLPYWSSTTAEQKKENPNHEWGYRDGIYFDEVRAPSWYFGFVPDGPFPECTWELSSRVTGDNINSRGGVLLFITQSNRGIQFRLDGAGRLWIAPSELTFKDYPVGPWIGPISHSAIRPGGAAYNKIRFDVRKRRLDIYINDVAVVNPMDFGWDLTPVSFAMGVDCQSPSVRAEHDRVEIGELREPLRSVDDKSVPLKPITVLANGTTVLPDGTHCFEGRGLTVANVTAGTAGPQWDLLAYQGIWTNDCQLLWGGGKANSVLTLDLPVEANGLYHIVPGFTLGPDFGRVRLALDDKPLFGNQPIDLYDPVVQPAKPISLGTMPLSPGTKKLTITIVGKNRASTGFVFGLDELRLVPVE